MRRNAANFAIQLIRRGFAANSSTSYDFNGGKGQLSLIDFSSIRGVNDAIGLFREMAAAPAILQIRRGFAVKSSTAHDIDGGKGRHSRRLPIDFSSVRDVNDAILLFRQMVNMSTNCNNGFQPSVVLYNKLFCVLVKMEEYSVALSLFDEMLQLGLPVSDYSFNTMINCCCLLHRVDLGFAMLGSLFRQDLKPDVVTFNTLLKGLYLVGKVAEAHTLLEKVLTFKLCGINDVMILTLINGLCKVGQTHIANHFLLMLEKGRHRPNVKAYNALVDGLCKAGLVEGALKLLFKMADKGIIPNVSTYNATIHGLCALNKWNDVRYLLLVEMIDHKVYLDVIGFNTLVDAFCKNGKMEEAEDIFETMIRVNISPDIVTYDSLLDGYCRQGRMDKAKEVFDSIVKGCLKPSIISFNTLIKGYCKSRNIDEATRLFHEIPHSGLKPNKVSYNIMIHGFFMEGRFADGWKLFKDLEAQHLHPSLPTYNGYCKSRDIVEARRLFHEIPHSGLKPDIISYNIMIHGFFMEGRFADGWKLFKDLEARHLHPSLHTYNILLDGLCRNQQIAEAFSFLSMIESIGVKPNIVTYNTLINVLCKTGKVDVARKIFNQLTSKGLQPDVETYSMIIGSLYREGLDEEGQCWFLEMERSGCAANNVTYNVIIQSLLKRKEVYKAIPFLEEMYTRGFNANTAIASMLLDQLQGEGKDDILVEMIEKVVPELKIECMNDLF